MSSGEAHPGVFEALRSLARGDEVEVTVRGGCMAPWLADGDRVRVTAARVYLPGDVVVFRAADGRLMVHRLLGYRLLGYRPLGVRPRAGRLALVTRGDSCPVHDAPVPLTAVLGRVRAAAPTARTRLRAAWRFLALALHRR